MKILHVCEYFYPLWEAGGVARSVFELSRGLVENGHEVTIYTGNFFNTDHHLNTNKKIDIEGIHVYYFENCKKYFGVLNRFIIPIPYYLPFIIRKEIANFDIIHIHEHRTLFAIIVYIYAKKYKIPIILQPRGSMPRLSKALMKTIFDKIIGNKIINYSSIIIASSHLESNQYKGVFPTIDSNKYYHIPNGIIINNFIKNPDIGRFKQRHSIEPEKKIILFLSRIHPRKGADILIEAFKKLTQKHSDVVLVIAGPDDGYLNFLKSLAFKMNINDKIVFSGPQYGLEKIETFVDAYIFILPSKDSYESFGNVALEASACGTPTIVTDCCGVSEWIPSIVVCKPNSDSIFQSLDEMLEQSVDERLLLKEKLVSESKKISQEIVTKEYENAYSIIMARKYFINNQ